jgi:addiction module RelE/StbE family toxin
MVYKLVVSKDAHRDIDEITSYIALELKNAQAAIAFLDDVEKSYRNVAENPFMYSLCNDERLRKDGYRKTAIKHYLVLYRVDEAANTVFIVRVVYGARDYSRLL